MTKAELAFDIYAALRMAEDAKKIDPGAGAAVAWGALGASLERYAERGDKDAIRAYRQFKRVFHPSKTTETA